MTPADSPTERHIIAGKGVDDGVLLVCSCGTETHVVTVKYEDDGTAIPTPMEQAYTCEGCGTSHWFQIGVVDLRKRRTPVTDSPKPETGKPTTEQIVESALLPAVTIETDAGDCTLAFGYAAVGVPRYSDVRPRGPWFPSESEAERYGAHIVLVGNWRSFCVEKRYFDSAEATQSADRV